MTRQIQPRARVAAMKEYHPPLGNRSGLRLDFNENTLACSPRVLEVLAQISAGSLTRYPERAPVEALVAAHLHRSPNELVLTNGVDEAIHVLFSAFLDAGDELLLPVPTYTMYEVYASATDATIVTVQADSNFAFPREKILAAITPRTKIIAIANPNSPTGSVVTREVIIELAARAPHAILLVDEAYYHFYGESVVDLIATIPNLVVARTFSKAYGLAGLRLGVLIGSASLMNWPRRVLSPYSVNTLALACLPAALDDEEFLRNYVAEICTAREKLQFALTELGIKTWPSEANFILAHIGPSHAEFTRRLHAQNILVRDRSSDPGCNGCVRITVGTRAQMDIAIPAIQQAMRTISLDYPNSRS